MFSRVFWIATGRPGRLAILSRPAADSLGEEIAAWRQMAVTIVVSLLEPREAQELGLAGEAELCRISGIQFLSFPIADRSVPASLDETVALARRLAAAIEDGSTVGVHCRAGIGRSAVIAASLLVALGCASDQAFSMISAARGVSVPDTEEQRQWVLTVPAKTARPDRA